MKDLIFNNIDITVDWGFIFGFISILSLLITWLSRTFKGSSQEIDVKEVSIYRLLNKPNDYVEDLKILLNDEEIEQLNKIELYFQNSGSKTLNSIDYLIFPKIDLSGYTNIISTNVSTSNEFTTCDFSKINPSVFELKIDNLEPKDYIRIDILFESINDEYKSSLKFRLKENQLKTWDLKEYFRDKNFGISKDYNAFISITAFAGITTYGLSYFLSKYGLGIDFSDPNNFSIGWKVLFFSPTFLICLLVIYKWNKTINRHHFGHNKIEKWYQKKKAPNRVDGSAPN